MTETYTLIGTPYSTFTRTIAMGMKYKGLSYLQVATTPRSRVAYENHPFGFLPTLIIHGSGDGNSNDIKLCESHAIVRYIDRIAATPSLHISSDDEGVILEEKMWEFVSFIAFLGFPVIEGGVIKPRINATVEGTDTDEETEKNIRAGVEKMKEFLSVVESRMAPEGFVFGDKISWADFFLYPLLADLKAIPEWKHATARVQRWVRKMEELTVVKATVAGTLAAGCRP
ncbi:hypothetical protein BDQ17DRAFT_1390897 [Cyathus striatus]|nr:hypothetical protein BDQ17DRAFT_1390897 [Cyathus striatus]